MDKRSGDRSTKFGHQLNNPSSFIRAGDRQEWVKSSLAELIVTQMQ